MIIWFKGISGVGKSTLGNYYFKLIKKKHKNFIFIDGDNFRKLFNNDLGYSLYDRNINASRLCNFVKFIQSQKINIVVAANLTSKKFQTWAKKKFHNYVSVYIESELSNLLKRDKKKIYKNKKDIVGININYHRPINSDIYLKNNSSKKIFLQNIKLIKKIIKKKKIIFD
jgi:adenylylsulfate kinase-like enzyme